MFLMLNAIMRNKNDKDRRLLRKEVVYKYRNEIAEFERETQTYHPSKNAEVWIDTVVRKEIPYSCKTNTIDIWIFLYRDFKNLVQSGLMQY